MNQKQARVKAIIRAAILEALEPLGEIISKDRQGDITVLGPDGSESLISPGGLAETINKIYQPLA